MAIETFTSDVKPTKFEQVIYDYETLLFQAQTGAEQRRIIQNQNKKSYKLTYEVDYVDYFTIRTFFNSKKGKGYVFYFNPYDYDNNFPNVIGYYRFSQDRLEAERIFGTVYKFSIEIIEVFSDGEVSMAQHNRLHDLDSVLDHAPVTGTKKDKFLHTNPITGYPELVAIDDYVVPDESIIEIQRTLPLDLNYSVKLGYFHVPHGAHTFLIGCTVSSTDFSVSKQYLVSTNYNYGHVDIVDPPSVTNPIYDVYPITSTGNWVGNDFQLEVQTVDADCYFSIRRSMTYGGVAGVVEVQIRNLGYIDEDIFTEETATFDSYADENSHELLNINDVAIACPEKFGAYGNGVDDDSDGFIKCLNATKRLDLIPGKTYILKAPVSIPSNSIINGNFARVYGHPDIAINAGTEGDGVEGTDANHFMFTIFGSGVVGNEPDTAKTNIKINNLICDVNGDTTGPIGVFHVVSAFYVEFNYVQFKNILGATDADKEDKILVQITNSFHVAFSVCIFHGGNADGTIGLNILADWENYTGYPVINNIMANTCLFQRCQYNVVFDFEKGMASNTFTFINNAFLDTSNDRIYIGNDTNSYKCVRNHTSTADDMPPGVSGDPVGGDHWRRYWVVDDAPAPDEWAVTTDYTVGFFGYGFYFKSGVLENAIFIGNKSERLYSMFYVHSDFSRYQLIINNHNFSNCLVPYSFNQSLNTIIDDDEYYEGAIGDVQITGSKFQSTSGSPAAPEGYAYKVFDNNHAQIKFVDKEWILLDTYSSKVLVDAKYYKCIRSHTSSTAVNRPNTGSSWNLYWSEITEIAKQKTNDEWLDSTSYVVGRYDGIWDGTGGGVPADQVTKVINVGELDETTKYLRCINSHTNLAPGYAITEPYGEDPTNDWQTYWEDVPNIVGGTFTVWSNAATYIKKQEQGSFANTFSNSKVLEDQNATVKYWQDKFTFHCNFTTDRTITLPIIKWSGMELTFIIRDSRGADLYAGRAIFTPDATNKMFSSQLPFLANGAAWYSPKDTGVTIKLVSDFENQVWVVDVSSQVELYAGLNTSSEDALVLRTRDASSPMKMSISRHEDEYFQAQTFQDSSPIVYKNLKVNPDGGNVQLSDFVNLKQDTTKMIVGTIAEPYFTVDTLGDLRIRNEGNIYFGRHDETAEASVHWDDTNGYLVVDPPGFLLNSTISADHTYSGPTFTTMTIDAGQTVAFGTPLYVASDGQLEVADADADTTMPALFLATGTAVGTATVLMISPGTFARDNSWNWTVGGTDGVIYVSTSGTLTQTRPSGNDDIVQPVGVAISADVAFFCSMAFVKVSA